MIGDNIKYFRKLKGVTQHELAIAIGHKSAAYVSFLEEGKRNVNAEDLFRIATVLEVPIEAMYCKEIQGDMRVITLKAGQPVWIDGVPLQLTNVAKAVVHRGNFSMIEKSLI